MSITVNEKTLTALLTQSNGKSEMIALLNEIIDEEIVKDEMDTDLVNECVEAILDLENRQDEWAHSSYQALMRYCNSNLFKKAVYLKRASLVASAALIALFVTIAASPALANQAKDILSSIMVNLGIAADSTDTGKSEIVSIYAVPKDNVSFTVKSESEIKPEEIEIIAVDKYNYEKQIQLSECKVNKDRLDSERIMLTFSYEGCACSVIYKLEVTS